jgi:ABC-type uncharacterized transport system involved in gliding motility auxiliary subunit
MKKNQFETLLYSLVGVAAMCLIVIVINFIGGAVKVRQDMTAEKAYTLSAGTRAILKKLDGPVELRFYFTQGDKEIDPQIKSYAQRVEDLLGEYKQASGGKVRVKKFNPTPDSDAEERASLDGIEGQVVQATGEKFYLGLAINQLDQTVPIPALLPQKERQLEYDISRAISRVGNPDKPVVGVMTALPLFGTPSNPMMMRMGQQGAEPWVVIQELQKDFNVRQIQMDAERIDDDIKVLMVVHPKDISDKAQYAIDQFVLRGGKLIAYLDAMSLMDKPANAQNPMMANMPGGGSTLDKLLKAWGIQFDNTKPVVDAKLATPVTTRQDAPPEPHYGFLSLKKEQLAQTDILTADVNVMMMALAGAFTGDPAPGLTKTVLAKTTPDSQQVDGFTAYFNNEQVKKEFKPSGKEQTLALRLTGKFKTAFPDGKPAAKPDDEKKEEKKEEKKADDSLKESKGDPVVLLIGDTDIISDQASVQVQRFLGMKIITPFNGNLGFAQSAIEQSAGDANLIAVRARGATMRPFTLVQEKQAKADATYQGRVKQLEDDLRDTQTKLNELQSKKEKGQRYVLSPEQQAEVTKFREKERKAKADLKELRKDLRKEIVSLENRVKWWNILGMPVIVIFVGVALALYQSNRTQAK